MNLLCSHHVLISICIAVIVPDFTLVASRRQPKARKIKKYEIDFNDPYYTSHFELCKKLRHFNPVETFRAQSYAAAIYRKCGPQMIIRLASKYNFPAYGLQTAAKMLCLAINFIYGYFASDGGVILPENFPTGRIFELVNRCHMAIRNSNHKFRIKHRGSVYTANHTMLLELLNDLVPCVLYTENVTQPDGDYLKHALNHARIMLL